jgi:hypothetical protein
LTELSLPSFVGILYVGFLFLVFAVPLLYGILPLGAGDLLSDVYYNIPYRYSLSRLDLFCEHKISPASSLPHT